MAPNTPGTTPDDQPTPHGGGEGIVGVDDSFTGLDATEQAQMDAMRAGTDVPETPPADDQQQQQPPVEGQPEQQDGQQGQPGQQPEPAEADDDDLDDDPQPQIGADGQPKKRATVVSRHKFDRIRGRLRDAEKQLKESNDRWARGDERLRLINEALIGASQGEQQQGQQPAQDDPRPDPKEDIFAYAEWQGRQIERLGQQLTEVSSGIQQRSAETTLKTTFSEQARAFSSTEEGRTFPAAYQFLMAHRMRETALFHFGKDVALAEQDPSQALSQEEYNAVRQAVLAEERGIVENLTKQRKDVAKVVFGMAKMRGFDPAAFMQAQALQGGQQQQPQGQAPATPQGAKPGNGQQPAPQPKAKPSVAEEIKRAQGQAAFVSLSDGGGAPAQQLSPEMLADMPQDQFNDLLAALEEKGAAGRAELQRLMGYSGTRQ